LTEPLVCQVPYRLDDWNRSERIESLLGAKRFQFMISAPPEFFPLIRAFYGLFYWNQLFLGEIYTEPILREMEAFYKSGFIDRFSNKNPHSQVMARSIEIRIWKNGKESFSVNLPKNQISRLKSYLEPHVLLQIQNKGLDIDSIIRSALESGLEPSPLVEWEEGEKRVKISLV